MNARRAFRTSLLAALVALGSAGCDNSNSNMSQEDVQFLSHLDQARFFQRQGELKASTLEARSAMDLQPQRADPYFIMIDNLLTAGDAINAERQLKRLRDNIEAGDDNIVLHNRVRLALARAAYMQRQHDQAIEILGTLQNPDRTQQLEIATLTGDILLAQRKLDEAVKAYDAARQIDAQAIMPVLGLSRTALTAGDRAKADEWMQIAEQINSTDSELWLWKAQVAHQDQRYPEAEEAYIRALEDIGRYDVMTYRKYQTMSALIDVLRAQRKSAEAFVYEEILAKSAPGTIKSNFTAAQQAFAAGNLDKAAQHLQEILEQTPGHEQSTLLLGMIRFQQGRVKEAEALLAPYAQLDDATAATKLLAAAKLRLQQPGEARQLLEKLDESQSDPGVLALVAIASYASGDAITGRDYMTKALSLAPDNAVLRQRYALLLQASGETAAAIQEFRTILERTPDSTEARIALVSLLMQQGDKAQAQSVIDDWLKRYPESLAAQITAGDLELQNGNADAANRYYQKALKQAPEDYRPHIAMGNLLASANKIEPSLTHFEKAVSLAPENRAALRGLMAVANTAETHRARAQTFLKNLIAQKDEVVSPRLVLIEYGLVEGRLDEAAGYVESAIERSAQATDIHNLIATIYGNAAGFLMRQEKPAEAGAVVASGLKRFPEHEGLGLLAANLHFRRADELAAMEQLRQVKMHHPDSPRPFLMEAEYRVSKREFETAAELFRLASTKAESIVEIPLQQAGALQNAGQKGKALEVLEATIQKFPEHAQTRLALALAYQTNNKTAEAVANYEQLLLKTPDNPVALNNLAWLYKEQGNPKAEELAARAYKASPDSAAIIDTYGWILFKQGKVSESIPLLERAHTLDPAMKEIALHLAEAYKAAGEEDKARAVLEKM